MISTDMRTYNYWTFGEVDIYGQPTLSTEYTGSIKMAIYTTSKAIQDNINYSGANYLGLTYGTLTDANVVECGDERLKVLYVMPKGRYTQVFMARM